MKTYATIWHSNIIFFCWASPMFLLLLDQKEVSKRERRSPTEIYKISSQLLALPAEKYLCSAQIKWGFYIKKISHKIIQAIAVTFLEQCYGHCLFFIPAAPPITLLPMAWQLLKLWALLRDNSLVISTLLITSATILEVSWRKKQHGKK